MPTFRRLFFPTKSKTTSPKCQHIRHPNSLGPFLSKGEGYFPKDHIKFKIPYYNLTYPYK